jgi:hypothetical protein
MKKVNWIIMSDSLKPPFRGGSVVLHYMAKKFLDCGDRVMMNNPHYEGVEKLTASFLIDKKNDLNEWVLLLTENDFRLEELNMKNIVRYLLYKPNNQKKYGFNELIIQHGKSFTVRTNYECSLSIKPMVSKLNFWEDMKIERSEKDLVLKKKGNINQSDKIYQGVELDGLINSETPYDEIEKKLKELFNKYKKFITYDNDTFHSVQAALCGAISVVIPDGRLTEEEWRSSNNMRKWGIAYGDTDEQIDFAIRTREKLIENFNNQITKGDKDIEILRELVLNKFY